MSIDQTDMNTIKLELNIDEVNMVLEALGQLPFARVYALIGRIQEQAHAQIQAASAPAQPQQEAEK
jgi:hypothetical protein